VKRECSTAAAMLGLPGFVVLAVSDYDGDLEQAIETTADLVPRPDCTAEAVGLDESAFQGACVLRSTRFVTGIVELTRRVGPARLLDVIDEHSASALVN